MPPVLEKIINAKVINANRKMGSRIMLLMSKASKKAMEMQMKLPAQVALHGKKSNSSNSNKERLKLKNRKRKTEKKLERAKKRKLDVEYQHQRQTSFDMFSADNCKNLPKTTNFLHLLAMFFHRLVRNARKLQEILRLLLDTMIILVIRIGNLMLNRDYLLHLGEVGREADILLIMWTIAHIVKDAMRLIDLKEIFI